MSVKNDKYIVTSVLSEAFPTALLRWLLLALLCIIPISLELADNPTVSAFLQLLQSEKSKPLLLMLTLFPFILLLIILEFALLCKHNIKHVTAIHRSSCYPFLSIKWLYKNLKASHYIFIALMLVFTFYCGYLVGST